jgi:hypothetical protein
MGPDSHPLAYIPFAECARTSAASPLGTEGATADVNATNKSNWHACAKGEPARSQTS